MSTKIKIVTSRDFLEVTPYGAIDITTSRKLLVDIAKAEHSPADYDLLIDFRDTRWYLSTSEVYQLASELSQHGDTFLRKVAVLILPGLDFKSAAFLATCSHNRGFSVEAFTDFEIAIHWLLSSKNLSKNNIPPNKTDAGDDI